MAVIRTLTAAGSVTGVLEEGDDVIVRAQTKGSDVCGTAKVIEAWVWDQENIPLKNCACKHCAHEFY